MVGEYLDITGTPDNTGCTARNSGGMGVGIDRPDKNLVRECVEDVDEVGRRQAFQTCPFPGSPLVFAECIGNPPLFADVQSGKVFRSEDYCRNVSKKKSYSR